MWLFVVYIQICHALDVWFCEESPVFGPGPNDVEMENEVPKLVCLIRLYIVLVGLRFTVRCFFLVFPRIVLFLTGSL